MNRKHLRQKLFLAFKNNKETSEKANDFTKIAMDAFKIGDLEDHKNDMFHIWIDKKDIKIMVKNLRNGKIDKFEAIETFYFVFGQMMLEELKFVMDHGENE